MFFKVGRIKKQNFVHSLANFDFSEFRKTLFIGVHALYFSKRNTVKRKKR